MVEKLGGPENIVPKTFMNEANPCRRLPQLRECVADILE